MTDVVATGLSPRARWLIGGGAAVATGAAAIVAFMVLSARPVPEALKYVPGDSGAVAELRLDLPGDQLQHVGNLLAHFPGFKDQSTLPAKIDESLDRLVGAVTNGQQTHTARLKPWLAGPTFVGVGAPSAAASGSPPPPTPVATPIGSAAGGSMVGLG